MGSSQLPSIADQPANDCTEGDEDDAKYNPVNQPDRQAGLNAAGDRGYRLTRFL
ncbi:hypothetical protein ABT237_20910 [Streptomyces sp. NPDC001581]|uniref:hypothetical protein n=1 Tax=Streptomyces sp. NPDC001581 TaxID=3154386 RepID=UPI00331D2BCF